MTTTYDPTYVAMEGDRYPPIHAPDCARNNELVECEHASGSVGFTTCEFPDGKWRAVQAMWLKGGKGGIYLQLTADECRATGASLINMANSLDSMEATHGRQ